MGKKVDPETRARMEREMEERARLPFPPMATVEGRRVSVLRFMAELGKAGREKLPEITRRDMDIAVMRVRAARAGFVPVIEGGEIAAVPLADFAEDQLASHEAWREAEADWADRQRFVRRVEEDIESL